MNQEGTVAVDGYKVWFRRVGKGRIPLLTLHGGPGAGHDYLEPLSALASEREVIFYDQLGCGRSDQPSDPSLWRIERFVAEIDTLRMALGLEQIYLFGQSWGGWLAIEYMLTQPKGVLGLVLASTSSSIQQFLEEAEKLKAQLPPPLYATMQKCEAAADYQDPEYQAAVLEFYKRHLCRLDPWPEALQRTNQIIENNPVYLTMNGPNEFVVNGNLRQWNRTERLHEIKVPTLITVGRYDEISPACAQTLHQGIPNSTLLLFEHSSHTAHLEQTPEYLQALSGFFRTLEQDP